MSRLTDPQRAAFDDVLAAVIEDLPPAYRRVLDEIPVVVLDRPDAALIRALVKEEVIESEADAEELCGLHTGVALTDRSLEDTSVAAPDHIHVFRVGVINLIGGWPDDQEGREALREEIEVTLLHEIGHHFGLGETDLEDLGYG